MRVTAARSVSFSVLIRKAKASRPVRIVREVFALLSLLRLRRETYAWQKYRDTSVYRSVKGVRELTPGKVAKAGFGFTMKASAMATIAVLILVPGIQAFEAHIVNVTSEPAMIDPPTLTPPGNNDATDPVGGTGLSGTVDVVMTDPDPDATHIYFTYGPGLAPGAITDPVCGEPNDADGGGDLKTELIQLSLTSDTVIKAIACDGTDGTAHKSLINIKIYDFDEAIATIEGYKYHDLDQDGIFNNNDFQIQGWQMVLKVGNATTSITSTDASGFYSFSGMAPDTYTVDEEDRDGWEHISPASGEQNVIISGNETEVVNFYNFDTGFACIPVDVDFPLNLAVLAAGEETGSDDINVSSNVTINGNARSNDDIIADGSGTNRFINGHAIAGDDVEEANFTISGSLFENATTTVLPDINIPLWQDLADDGGTVNGSFSFPNSTVGLQMGPIEILGDLTFGSSNGVTVNGPIYVHGDLSIGSNTIITQAAGFGDQFATIIVDGTIDIDANVAFVGSGTIGTFLLVSTHAAVSSPSDDAAIETSSNNSDLGDVVLYASNGDIHINSNRTLLAIFAKDGTSSSGPAIDLDSNVTVTWRTLPDTISCGARQPYEFTDQIVINEFMPNPGETDSGFVSPSATAAPNDWGEDALGDASNAFTSDGLYAEDNDSGGDQKYITFNIPAIPTGATIDGIEVTAEAKSTDSSGCKLGVTLFGDTAESDQNDENLTNVESILTLGSPTDDWDETWEAADFTNANFELELENIGGGSCAGGSTTSVDHIQVKVYYTVSDTGSAGGPLDGEWVELFNPTGLAVDVSEYVLYDEVNTNELFITAANTDTGGTVVPSLGFLVVYREGDGDFSMDNSGGDTVRLFDDEIGSGVLVDSHTYAIDADENKSFARVPDGTSNWIDPDATPGEPNTWFLSEIGAFEDVPTEPQSEEEESDEEAEESSQDAGESSSETGETAVSDEEQTNGSTDEETASASVSDETADGQATEDEPIICAEPEIVDSSSETRTTEGLMNEGMESSFASDEATEGLAEQGDLSSDSSPSPGEEEVVVECVAQDEESSSAEATEGLTEEQSEETPQETTEDESSSAEASDGQQEAILTNVQIKPDDEPADNPDGDTPPPPDPEPIVSEGLFGETLSTNSVDSVLPPASE
ncbi:hypothetical protein A3J34_02715 [Candidatus Peribacteria bacterium RIFCSPLOWO2_02_FULL_51_10]|nr:MAG: hypothetical protein A3J34_02715 [Candidatus Peribacteria bacterium RIFCSPLOWO2_02_FULL_51_10]